MLNKNKTIIKLLISMILMFVIFSGSNVVFASDGDSLLANIINDIDEFEQTAEDSEITIKPEDVTKDFKSLGQILTMIGAGVMVSIATYMGIKYLTAGPDAQAKLKEQLIGVVVSGVVIFGAYFIWSTVINIASNL